jgi:hypothetical protein
MTQDTYEDTCQKLAKSILGLVEQKNVAYSERDQLVCALSKCFPSWLERHPDSDTDWEDDWRWIVFIQFPTAQASWHIHDSEFEWFTHLEAKESNSWDGHTTEEKYERIKKLGLCNMTESYGVKYGVKEEIDNGD